MTAPMVDAIPMNRVSQNSPDEQVFVQPGPYPEEETQSHSHSQISVELEEAIEESSSQRAPEGNEHVAFAKHCLRRLDEPDDPNERRRLRKSSSSKS